MSYILDAVNKAETERQEQQSPFVYSLQSRSAANTGDQPSSLTRWVLLAGLLLILINLAAWQYSTLSHFLSGQKEDAASGEHTLALSSNSTAASDAASSVAGSSTTEAARVKLWQATAEVQTAIAALDFSFHVYSNDPARRTIIINGQRMGEGSQISASLSLEEITKKGVLIGHANALVDVEILQQW